MALELVSYPFVALAYNLPVIDSNYLSALIDTGIFAMLHRHLIDLLPAQYPHQSSHWHISTHCFVQLLSNHWDIRRRRTHQLPKLQWSNFGARGVDPRW